jgi:hypothetical protein
VKPGDRIEVTGVFKCISPSSSNGYGNFKNVIVATRV